MPEDYRKPEKPSARLRLNASKAGLVRGSTRTGSRDRQKQSTEADTHWVNQPDTGAIAPRPDAGAIVLRGRSGAPPVVSKGTDANLGPAVLLAMTTQPRRWPVSWDDGVDG
jgi:hypothetical protein